MKATISSSLRRNKLTYHNALFGEKNILAVKSRNTHIENNGANDWFTIRVPWKKKWTIFHIKKSYMYLKLILTLIKNSSRLRAKEIIPMMAFGYLYDIYFYDFLLSFGNVSIKTIYYSTIASFYHIRAKERPKYATLLYWRTGQKYALKRSDKMAAQNEPNLAMFTTLISLKTEEWWNNKSIIRCFNI